MIAAVAVTAVLSISLLVSLIVVANKSDDETEKETTLNPTTTISTTSTEATQDPKICLTKTCIDTASKILSRIDESVDPCEDFYEFSCAKFLKETVIPDDKAAVNSFNTIEDEVRVQLRKIVEEPVENDEIEPIKNVKNLYKSCMNTAEIDEQGNQPILDVLESLGGFSLLDPTWDSDGTWSWVKFVVEAKKKGFKPESFFNFDVSTDFKESSRRTIEVRIKFSKEMFINDVSFFSEVFKSCKKTNLINLR